MIYSEFVFRIKVMNPAYRATTALFGENRIELFTTLPSNLPMYIPTTSANRMSSVEFFISEPEICYW